MIRWELFHTDDSILAAIFWYGSIVGLSGWFIYTLYTEYFCRCQTPPSPRLVEGSEPRGVEHVTDYAEI